MITTYKLVNQGGPDFIVRRLPSHPSIAEAVRDAAAALDLLDGPALTVRVYDEHAIPPRTPTRAETKELEVAVAKFVGTQVAVHPVEDDR
jgi:hypothetical protein